MGRLRAIACENITSEHIDPFEVIVVSHAAQEPVIYVSEAAPSASSFPLKPTGHGTASLCETCEILVRCANTRVKAMSSQRGALQGGMCSRTSVCRPRVHLIETALDEGCGDHLDGRGRHEECDSEVPSASVSTNWTEPHGS